MEALKKVRDDINKVLELIEKNDVEVKITMPKEIYILKELGMPAKLKGYKYLQMAIALCTKNEDFLYKLTRRLYPKIAEEYQVTYLSVERSIRNAINITFNRGNKDIFSKYFGNINKPPKNSDFIATIVEAIKFTS